MKEQVRTDTRQITGKIARGLGGYAHGLWIAIAVILSLIIGSSARGAVKLQTKQTYRFATPNVTFSNQFPGARLNDCVRYSENEYHVSIRPERFPINDSAWYAFQVAGDQPRTVTVRLLYQRGTHRYRPKLSSDGVTWKPVEQDAFRATPSEATLRLKIGPTPVWVAAQERIAGAQVAAWCEQLAEQDFVQPSIIGRSVENRPILKLDIGEGEGGKSVFIMARQHPPEITGALGMIDFVETICSDSALARTFRDEFRTTVVPLANPDGVAHGQWRCNLNGVDLNRDWEYFEQPETRALRDELLNLDRRGRLCLFLDFHSTYHDVFYTHTDSPGAVPAGFTRVWLANLQQRLPDYPVRRDMCKATRSTSRAWVRRRFGIPAITYEFGDNSDRDRISTTASAAAEEMMRVLLATVHRIAVGTAVAGGPRTDP